ncbi:MAG: trans-2-enoyl-CoA reductase family protein [Planctomycetes bacterium]|nr:trans-2-enoyl-CoA reductase family protein [Planctomycetota bacterium]
MTQAVINPRIRGFICLTAHPEGCAANVRRQVELARAGGPGKGIGRALVVGSSAGYGLSSLITAIWGHGAEALSVAYERPGQGDRPGSAGWYNLAEVHRLAKAEGRHVETINGDAFSTEISDQALARLKARFGKLDTFVYSLASPKRTDPINGETYGSVLKPIGPAFTSKTINLDTDQIGPITLPSASETEIAATRKVMGGEDWFRWVEALAAADLLAPGFRTVAYSYIGPQMTHAIYRAGTIGGAKDHLEATARRLSADLQRRCGGAAWVSVNKALVTQASSAIPVVPLYISLLYKVMRQAGKHEGTIEQIIRLFRDHYAPGRTPTVDDHARIRVDDWEMAADIQAEVAGLWERVTTENLASLGDYAGFKREFRSLFGFELDGVDYAAPVEVERALV